MNVLDNFKSKITYENKTIIGIVGIVLAIILWVLNPYIGFVLALLTVLPAIFLVIPNITIKNSKTLSTICIILLILFLILLIFGLSSSFSYKTIFPYESEQKAITIISIIFELILSVYGLFCAFVMRIQTQPKQPEVTISNNTIQNNPDIKFDKYCSKCGHGLFNDSKFCPGCGTELKPED